MSNGKNPLMLMMALSVPGAAQAIGLGDIHVDSALNERFAAEIDIVGATALELADLRAKVPNSETFVRLGAERPAFLASATFKVAQDSHGHPVLVVRSSESFTDPVVNFLVDLNWRNGELVRQYTLLLDPAGFSPVPKVVPASAMPATPAIAVTSAASAPSVAAAPAAAATPGVPVATPSAAPAVEVQSQDDARSVRKMTHVKVGARATLRGIAWRVGERSPSDLQRMMIAIFRANPAAFDGNINRLHRGALLTIPSQDELSAISTAEARREFHAQMAAWRSPAILAASDSGLPAPADVAEFAPATATTGTIAPTGAIAAAALPSGDAALDRRVKSLEQELRESNALLESKHDQVVAMQRQVALAEAGKSAAADGEPAADAPVAGTSSVTQLKEVAVLTPIVVTAGQPTVAVPGQPKSQFTAFSIAAAVGMLVSAFAALYFKFRRRPVPARASLKKAEFAAGDAPAGDLLTGRPAAAESYTVELVAGDLVAGALAHRDVGAGHPATGEPGAGHPAAGPATAVTPASRAAAGVNADFDADMAGAAQSTTHAHPHEQTVEEAEANAARYAQPVSQDPLLAGSPAKKDDSTQPLLPVIAADGTTGRRSPDATVKMHVDTVDLKIDPTRLDYNLLDLDMTAQHVHMPSALNEQVVVKERRTSLADVLKLAIEREPDRHDLRLKLLELYYSAAATNRQAFLEVVQKFAREKDYLQPDQWAKIAMMGRQIAGENPMFAEASTADDDLADCA